MLLISLCMQFWYTCVIYKCLNCATYLKHLLFIFIQWNTWLKNKNLLAFTTQEPGCACMHQPDICSGNTLQCNIWSRFHSDFSCTFQNASSSILWSYILSNSLTMATMLSKVKQLPSHLNFFFFICSCLIFKTTW